MRSDPTTRDDRLYERALRILHGQANGHYLPILRHLARVRHAEATVELANFTPLPRRQAHALYRSALRLGSLRAAQHLAMDAFNDADLAGYRRWLLRAVRAGDSDARAELRRFETRLPHAAARRIGRLRSPRRD